MLARLLVLAALLAGSLLGQSTSTLFSQVDQMLRGLSEITGWKVQRKVPSEILHKDTFRKQVEKGVKGAEADKDNKAAETTLKMFGLVPPDFDLARESADLITEQAAAFYDINKKRLFVMDTTQDTREQRLVLAHELSHALADQQHSIKKFMAAAMDDEESSAREAVVEGQASWLSWAYVLRRPGVPAEVPASLLDELSNSAGADGDEFPVYHQAPLYIRESLTFPYTDGMRFQDAVYRKLGSEAFEHVFHDPPHDTHQIIHPDAYLASQTATTPVLPSLETQLGKEGRRFRALQEGHVGEFDVSVLLRQFIAGPASREEAAHWRGGLYRLYEHKQKKYPLLVHSTDWDSPDAAQKFFQMYQQVLHAKWKKMEVASSSDKEVRGTGDNGQFWIHLDGTTVQVIEGLN